MLPELGEQLDEAQLSTTADRPVAQGLTSSPTRGPLPEQSLGALYERSLLAITGDSCLLRFIARPCGLEQELR